MRTDPVLEIEHRVAAPPEIVFTYFTDPERLGSWVGSDAELDPRPGGIYRVNFSPDVAIAGEYITVEPPTRVVFSWGWSSAIELPGDIHKVGPGSTVVDVTLVADGADTIVRLKHRGFSDEDLTRAHGGGWDYSFSRLDARIAGRDPGPFATIDAVAHMVARGARGAASA